VVKHSIDYLKELDILSKWVSIPSHVCSDGQ